MKLTFPKPFHHDHPPVRNVNDMLEAKETLSQRAADRVTNLVGSWKFIIFQSIILAFWVVLNVIAWKTHWDPYPFILMNLILSLQAAYTAPVIMMSQNRQATRDRIEAHNDYEINKKVEEEVRTILEHLESQNQVLRGIYRWLSTSDVPVASKDGQDQDHWP
jgi:uncharacterized membrane protein